MTDRAARLSERAPSPPARALTVSAALVRATWAYARQRGVPPAVARATLADDLDRLDDPDHRVASARYDAFFAACGDALHDADFGLRLGAASRVSQLGVLGFLLLASATLGEALEAYAQYQRALGETLQVKLARRGGLAVLALQGMSGAAAGAARIESMAASLHVVCAELAGRQVPWESASFEHLAEQPGRAAPLRRLLGVTPVRGPNRLRCPIATLDWPLAHGDADAALRAVLRERLERRTRALARASTAEQVAGAIRRRLNARRRPALDEIARELQLTARVLQERLQAEGKTFRALVDAARRDSAVAFLRGGASAAEVAHLLGFAEEAAFFRAFKKWTGMTPAAARRAG